MEVDVEELNIEYVSEQLDLSEAGLEAFSDVFARFQLPPEEPSVSLIPFLHFSLSLSGTFDHSRANLPT